jgi:hypothetical protein
LVELLHVRQRHTHVAHRLGTIREIQGRCCRRRLLAADTQQQRFHVEARRAAAGLDRTLHVIEAVVGQQVQDADIMLDATPGAVLTFQVAAQFVEDGRQLPVPQDVGMVQRRRPALQRVQVMPRLENLLMLAIAAGVRGDHLPVLHDVYTFHVGFDGHGLEGGRARYAVAVRVVADHLILVCLGRLHHAGVEGATGQ